MPRFIDTAVARLRDDAVEWRLGSGAVRWLAVVPVAIALVGATTFPFRDLYAILANEDGVVEWSQVILLMVMVATYAHIAVLLWRADRKWLAAAYGLATLGSLLIAGEEISWGQRVLGFATPAGLAEINDQGETNLHNIGIVVKVFNLVVLAICAAAIALPILRWTGWRGTARTVAGYALVPPLALIPAFAFPFLHRVVRLAFLPDVGARATKFAEYAEASFYFGLVVFALLARQALISALNGRVDRVPAAPLEANSGPS